MLLTTSADHGLIIGAGRDCVKREGMEMAAGEREKADWISLEKRSSRFLKTS